MMRKLVIRRAEQRMTCVFAIPRSVDQRLGMLDPISDREWFCFNVNAAVVQHLKSVAGAVSDREHDVFGVDRFAARKHNTLNQTVLDNDIGDPAFKSHFTAQANDGLAHALHDRDEPERADVRFAYIKNFRWRPGFDELGEYFTREMAWIL